MIQYRPDPERKKLDKKILKDKVLSDKIYKCQTFLEP